MQNAESPLGPIFPRNGDYPSVPEFRLAVLMDEMGRPFCILHSQFSIQKSRAPACAAESPKLSLPGAAPGRLADFFVGTWQKSDAPALQAGSKRERYPPSSTILRLEPEQREGCKQISK